MIERPDEQRPWYKRPGPIALVVFAILTASFMILCVAAYVSLANSSWSNK